MKLRIITIFLSICFASIAMAKDVTLKEKIGQMLMIGFKGTELHKDDPIAQAILEQKIGGVLLYDYDFQTKKFDRNIKNPQQVKQLTHDLQNYARTAAEQHHNQLVPLLIGIDYEGGKVNRLKEEYGFPKTLSAAAIGEGSVSQAENYAQQMAATLSEMGINFNFAPLLDVNVNPDSPAIGKLQRSFSSDPKKVAEFASIFAKAYRHHKILCSYKHFPGHGSATGDTHLGFVDVTDTWQEYELDPYKNLFQTKNSCDLVMTAHVINNKLDASGHPASISQAMTTKLLRGKLGFSGAVITDDLQMKAIADNYGLHEAVLLAVNSGADILMFANQLVKVPQDPQEIIDMIYQDVQAGKISKQRIESAYQRIIKLKKDLKK